MFIQPNWPAPKHIKAYTTTRLGGTSKAPFDQFNLGDHVDDNPEDTANNRAILTQALTLPTEPIWIKQTHSTQALEALHEHTNKEADASFTQYPDRICVVLTADCLPLLICNLEGTEVAAIHAGWRGLANGIIESTLSALKTPRENLLVWLGPAISATHFEVGDDVRETFISAMPEATIAFSPSPNQRWLADLYELARLRLKKQGISMIYGGDYCTYSNPELFYSYRRDGKTGRMASLIWLNNLGRPSGEECNAHFSQ